MSESPSRPREMSAALPDFEILELLGEGGMGRVHKARHLRTGQVVAIKELYRDSFGPPQACPALREHRLIASLRHPNLVAVSDLIRSQGTNYLILELVEGHNLRARMVEGKPTSPQRTLGWLNPICEGVCFLHENGLLHLDLKPENVLCEERTGLLKVSDFGLVRTLGEGEQTIPLGEVRASLDYAAPEQRFGLPVDERTDVYAIASLAYELLTGAPPRRVHISACEKNRAVSPETSAVLRRALSRHPEERPSCVAELRERLNRAEDHS